MIIIHALFDVKADAREQFLSAAQPLLDGSQAEAGNISYNLFEKVGAPNQFIMVEQWQDQVAVDVHNQTEHFTHFGAISDAFFNQPTKVTFFSAEEK
ncbi:MAG: putative quinol monooxygenase [Sporolactobacillus sp.]